MLTVFEVMEVLLAIYGGGQAQEGRRERELGEWGALQRTARLFMRTPTYVLREVSPCKRV